MQGKGFITLWFVASISMALMSLGWHGWLLNDFARLEMPALAFGTMFSVCYLGIGFLLTALFVGIELDIRKPIKGLLLGGVTGFGLHLSAFALGFSFQDMASSEHMLFDFAWQMLEQALGGMVVGFVYPLVAMPDTRKSNNEFTLQTIIKKNTTAA